MSKAKEERVSSQVMELKDLIAGPLLATIDADSMSAQRYLDYLFKITFESYDPVSGKVGALRMLTFSYQSRDLTGPRTQSVSIPLLTLVPLPLLQVQEADFDFDIQVLDASSKQQQSSFSFEKGDSMDNAGHESGKDIRLRVALTTSSINHGSKPDNRQSSVSANMKVHVKMRQADMPGGLSTLLSKAVNNMASDVTYTLPKDSDTKEDISYQEKESTENEIDRQLR